MPRISKRREQASEAVRAARPRVDELTRSRDEARAQASNLGLQIAEANDELDRVRRDDSEAAGKLADAKGIKIRTPQNALMVSTFKALGLEPTAVSFSETFNALQQGVVDGQEGCFNNVVTLKFYEAQKYATMINYSVHSANIIASERWLQSLPEKERNALIRAGKEAMEYERTKVAGMLESDDKLMVEHGMELLGVVEDLSEWTRLGRTSWLKCYDVLGYGNADKGKAIMAVVLSKKEALANAWEDWLRQPPATR